MIATIRAAIVATLTAIPDIGVVHSHERYAKAEKDFRELYLAGERILGWNVRRTATRERVTDRDDPDVRMEEHTWTLRGYMSLADAEASELAFDALIESVRAAFRADDTLGGTVYTCVTDEAAGIQVVDSGPVMLSGVLCHSARLTLTTVSYIQ